MNHVGITVTDIYEAVEWYQDVFDCTVVMAPIESKEDGSHFSGIVSHISQLLTAWVLSFFNLVSRRPSAVRTISSIGKPGYFIFA